MTRYTRCTFFLSFSKKCITDLNFWNPHHVYANNFHCPSWPHLLGLLFQRLRSVSKLSYILPLLDIIKKMEIKFCINYDEDRKSVLDCFPIFLVCMAADISVLNSSLYDTVIESGWQKWPSHSFTFTFSFRIDVLQKIESTNHNIKKYFITIGNQRIYKLEIIFGWALSKSSK